MRIKKGYRIKKYRNIYGRRRRKSSAVLKVILSIVVIAALVFVGYSVAKPLFALISGDGSAGDKQPSSSVGGSSVESGDNTPAKPEISLDTKNLKTKVVDISSLTDTNTLNATVATLKNEGVNAVIIELKDGRGNLFYTSSIAHAENGKVISETAIADIGTVADTFRQNGITPIAKINIFRDSLILKKYPEWAIKYMDSDWLWLDDYAENGGKAWMNPYVADACNYQISIAKELCDNGFNFIMVDSVMYPDALGTSSATYAANGDTRTRAEVLKAFVSDLKSAINEKGCKVILSYNAQWAQKADNYVYAGQNPAQFDSDYYTDDSGITIK